MIDFLLISTRSRKSEAIEIYPRFIIKRSQDLMIRGGDFYAIWLEEQGIWSTDEQDALQLIDKELDKYFEEHKDQYNGGVRVLHMWDAESGMIDVWHKYCQKQMRDSFHMLDERLIFSNTEVKKKDYASKKLPYPLEKGEIKAYDRLMSVLYSPEERHKLEWAIGSIVTGDSRYLQKFIVLYGPPKSGKSTVINLIEKLFDGYVSVFDAKSLGSANNSFALEAFRSNPLVAIQHDGDLSRIEDNTRLNSLVSHELMTVNEKFKSAYSNRFKCFLFMATNKPVKITDAKSGLLRRLIDVSPTGDRVSPSEYEALKARMEFELGAIAWHCKEVYDEDPRAYDNYVPVMMLGASNDFYNFIMDSYYVFEKEDNTTLKAAWEMYGHYCEEAKVAYPYSMRAFKEELKNYFKEYYERFSLPDGSRVRSYYKGFYIEKYGEGDDEKKPLPEKSIPEWLRFDQEVSLLDTLYADCPAQYASSTDGQAPGMKWSKVVLKLKNLDTHRLHYVKPPDVAHIVADFDLKDENGNKSLEKNIEAASLWPPTYAELSKSGEGIHLHYIYDGDVDALLRVYAPNIEIKIFNGNSSLRRKLTRCNNYPITTINSGLPLKGEKEKPMINFKAVETEQDLRRRIENCLSKSYENVPSTTQNIDLIKKMLDDAYESGLKYDLSDMHNIIRAFAGKSSNQKERCIKTVSKMHFKSDEPSMDIPFDEKDELVIYDVECYPNLFLICWKVYGKGKPVQSEINPSPERVRQLFKRKLVGFNCRGYDNHMLYARGEREFNNLQLSQLSQKLIAGAKGAKFGEAFNLSYVDLLEISTKKQSLKKWEIELKIHHQEMGFEWNEPIPEDKWPLIVEYCTNDVLATEALFDHIKGDYDAACILAALSGMTVNDNGNAMSERFIFGDDPNPQAQFNWRDLSKPVRWSPEIAKRYRPGKKFRIFDANGEPTYQEYIPGTPLPDGYSILPFFPEYHIENGKSYFNGTEVGEGGAVYGDPGIYVDVDDEDVSSMHPHSATADDFFGPIYTPRFEELVEARVAIKHGDLEKAGSMLGGALKPFLNEANLKALAQALKIVINKVYGQSAAKYKNRFKDPRNIDNYIAKRGAVFMYKLKTQVEKRGYKVAHIKTDSIKIPNATEEIIRFVREYGAEFGYSFEQEYLFDRFCLVNDTVYVAKIRGGKNDGKWITTGTQFAVPYVYKMLGFIPHYDDKSGETVDSNEILFDDMCETKSVQTALYLGGETEDDDCEPRFVGKVGQFCPMKQGCGSRKLLRKAEGKDGSVKYAAVVGTKDNYWMESELVKTLHLEDQIDHSYYDKLVTKAIETINKYGDYERFVAPEPYVPSALDGFPLDDDDLPWYP